MQDEKFEGHFYFFSYLLYLPIRHLLPLSLQCIGYYYIHFRILIQFLLFSKPRCRYMKTQDFSHSACSVFFVTPFLSNFAAAD